MSEAPSLPPRPAPPRNLREQASGWLTWFGPVRIASTAVAVAIVVAGGYWLVRSPAPPTEAGLPVASASSSGSPTSTLPPPSTAVPSTSAPPLEPAVVHVAGAVAVPGVYRLDGDARVHAAIEAAGGPSAEADLNGLNLAAVVADGQRIYVPVAGEVDPSSVPSGPISDGPSSGEAPTGPIDLNRATADVLETLPGIGPATAAAIVDDRDRNGPYASVDDLDRVSGIGPAKLAAIRDLVTV